MIYSKNSRGKSVLFILTVFVILGFNSTQLIAQPVLTWENLSDVTFTEKYNDELKSYWWVPTFGPTLKAYENKTVIMEGYFLPINAGTNFFVLSKFPFASCYFCGGAGPDSIVELQVSKKSVKDIRMDDRVQFEGTLILNDSDFNHCNYILKGARPLKRMD